MMIVLRILELVAGLGLIALGVYNIVLGYVGWIGILYIVFPGVGGALLLSSFVTDSIRNSG